MRILVIEDEPGIAQFLKKALTAECFAVDMAIDGEEGSYLARTNQYDMIVLDNILPKKGGLEVCKEIRSSGKKTPIIILSVRTETQKKIELLDAGADDYLIKPFSFDELMARIRALLRRPTAMLGEVLTVDTLVLDSKRHTVKRGDRDIKMGPREFALLEYLMRNENTALSKSMLLEHVWNMQIDPFSNTVEVHILALRKKISKENEKKLIHTVSGMGYKISANE